MLINRIGGAINLNFRVTAYASLPDSGKENEIAVITETPMTGYIMQAEQPEAVEGLVWIEVAATSDVAFYADKKEMVKLYPRSVRQYVDGNLENAEAYIYQNGKWEQFSYTIFLAYNYGTEGVAWEVGTNTTKGESSINYSGNIGGGTGTYKMLARTKSPIDLTELYSINILCDLNLSGSWNGYKYFGIRKDTTPDGQDDLMYTAHSDGSDNGEGKIISFNVLNLKGSYYIMVSAQTLNGGTGDGTFSIHKVWGEYIDGSGIALLYNAGVEDTDITGGWTRSGTGSKGAESIVLGGSNTYDPGRMYTENLVDITGFSTLSVLHTTVNRSEYGGIGITATKSNAENVGKNDGNSYFINKMLSSYTTLPNGTDVVTSLDISGIQGSYYLVVLSGNNGSDNSKTTVKSVWLA